MRYSGNTLALHRTEVSGFTALPLHRGEVVKFFRFNALKRKTALEERARAGAIKKKG